MDLPRNTFPFPSLITIRGAMLPGPVNMDQPSNSFSFSPLINIRGAMLPGPGTTGPPLPPLVSIRSLPSSAAHEVPKEPQQADPAQLLQAGNENSLGGGPEQQSILAGLREAQIQHRVLQSLEREHKSHLENMDNAIRDRLENAQELKNVLGGAIDRAQEFHQIADNSVKQAKDVTEIHAELAVLQKRNEDLQKLNEDLQKLNEDLQKLNGTLKKETQAMFERNAETTKLNFQAADKAKQLEAQVLQASDEARKLKSQLAASERKCQQLEEEAGTLRSGNNETSHLESQLSDLKHKCQRLEEEASTLRSGNNETSHLEPQLSNSEHKYQQLEEEASTLRSDNEKLRNGLDKLQDSCDQLKKEKAGLESQLDSSEDNVKKVEQQTDTLHNKLAKLQDSCDQLEKEKAGLKSQLDASEGKVKELEKEAGTLRSEHDKLCSNFENLNEEITKIPGLQSQLDASEGKVKQLENESETVQNEKKKLENKIERMIQHLLTGERAVEECKKLDEELKGAKASKRFYLEKYLSLRGAIRTVCRIRPAQGPPNREDPGAVQIEISQDEDGACLMVSRKEKSTMSTRELKKTWVLDHIFSATDNNDVVWEETRPLLESALDGAQVVVIFYGRTGTGKSFTSEGTWSRLARFLFTDTDNSGSSNNSNRGGTEEESTTQGDSSCDTSDPGEGKIRLWSVELYCGELRDLLVTTQGEGARERKLTLPRASGILHPVRQCSASSIDVSDRESLDTLLGQAALARTSGETRANKRSSRSHSFTCLELPDGGSITLVDLAGHERDSAGSSKDELQSINSSLTSLTQALGKLAGKKNVKNVWSSPELLPRIIGALLRGSSQDREQELKSKVMFLATLDFSTVESTKGSEHTLADLEHVGLIRKR